MNHRFKRLLYVFCVIGFSYSIIRTVADIREKGKRSMEIRQEIADLEKENEELKKEAAYKSSDEYIQKEAKDKLFMGFKGEKIILIPKEVLEEIRKEAYGEGKVAGAQDVQKPFWKKWLEVLGL